MHIRVHYSPELNLVVQKMAVAAPATYLLASQIASSNADVSFCCPNVSCANTSWYSAQTTECSPVIVRLSISLLLVCVCVCVCRWRRQKVRQPAKTCLQKRRHRPHANARSHPRRSPKPHLANPRHQKRLHRRDRYPRMERQRHSHDQNLCQH